MRIFGLGCKHEWIPYSRYEYWDMIGIRSNTLERCECGKTNRRGARLYPWSGSWYTRDGDLCELPLRG